LKSYCNSNILFKKSIAITILILFAILVIAVTLVLKQKKQKPVSGKYHNASGIGEDRGWLGGA
jgi:uncharacterized phage infection (PIP) family protein YhgE